MTYAGYQRTTSSPSPTSNHRYPPFYDGQEGSESYYLDTDLYENEDSSKEQARTEEKTSAVFEKNGGQSNSNHKPVVVGTVANGKIITVNGYDDISSSSVHKFGDWIKDWSRGEEYGEYRSESRRSSEPSGVVFSSSLSDKFRSELVLLILGIRTCLAL